MTSLLKTFINILIVAIWTSGQAFRAYGRGNMPLQAVKLPIGLSRNNVVGENTVLQLNILETCSHTRGSEFISNSTSSRWRWILTHSCENTSLQNVSVENLQLSLHSNTVYGIIKRFRERGNFVCGRRTRRPRKTNNMYDRVLYRLAREHRRFSVQRLRRAWQPNVNFAISRQTVNRRLVARAYRARRMVKVPRLTVRAKLVRRHWAQKHINRPLGQLQHVIIFCDESRFVHLRIDNRIRVRRLVGEAMNKDCTHGNVAHGGDYVHVWGGISHMGKTSLCVLDQMSLEPFIAEF